MMLSYSVIMLVLESNRHTSLLSGFTLKCSKLVSRLSSQMEIRCEQSRFLVFVDGQQLFDFCHRLTSLGDINTLWVKGSIAITKLAWSKRTSLLNTSPFQRHRSQLFGHKLPELPLSEHGLFSLWTFWYQMLEVQW